MHSVITNAVLKTLLETVWGRRVEEIITAKSFSLLLETAFVSLPAAQCGQSVTVHWVITLIGLHSVKMANST